MKARISRKFFCLLLTVVMACTLLPITALAAGPSGSIERVGITHANGVLKNAVSVDLKNVNFESSVEVQLYRDGTLLTTATLKGVNPGSYDFLTCCIATETADANWALTPWTPKDDVVPNRAVLVVDDLKLANKTFELNAEDWAALPGTAFPYSGSIERVGITHANGVLKNAVSVDLKNVNFESSVEVQLYRDGTLLTTATLKGVNPGSYDFLTCCIATETADANWALTPWTPKDDVVPNRAVLVVDGHELNTKTFTLGADEWAALPGTVRPSSNVTNGTASNNALQYKDADKTTPAPAATATPAPATTATPAPAATATPQHTIPQTGDTSNPALLVVLMLVSGSAAIGTAVVGSKKKHNR